MTLLKIQELCKNHPYCLDKSEKPHDDYRDTTCPYRKIAGCLFTNTLPEKWGFKSKVTKNKLEKLQKFLKDLAYKIDDLNPLWTRAPINIFMHKALESNNIQNITHIRAIIQKLLREYASYEPDLYGKLKKQYMKIK